MEQHQQSSLFNMNLDPQNSYVLRNTASWAKILGVVSIILGAMFMVIGFVAQSASQQGYRYRRSSSFGADFSSADLVGLVVVALVYAASGFFALTAGNKISTGLKTNNMETLNTGFAHVRNFFALWAILVILTVTLLGIGFLGNLGNS